MNPDQPFHGTWQATAEGRTLALVLVQSGTTLHGRIVHSPEYFVEIDGTAAANTARGKASGDLGDTRFEAVLGGDTLLLALIDRDRVTGKDVRLAMQFERLGRDAPLGPTPPRMERHDPALIGRWVQTAMTGSGSQARIVESHLQFDATGTFSRSDGSGAGTMPVAGRWRTVGDLLYTRPDEKAAWSVSGSWRLNGGLLMLDTGHGPRRWAKG